MVALTPEQRREIGEAAKNGTSITKLKNKYKCSRITVKRWKAEAEKARPNYADAPRSGRPSELSSAERRRIRRSALSGRTVPQIVTSVNQNRQQPVSAGTVRSVLVRSRNGLHWAPVNRSRQLSARNLVRRFYFCQDNASAQAGAWLYCDSKPLFLYRDGPGSTSYTWQPDDGQQQQRAGGDPVVLHCYAVVGKGFKSPLVYTAPSAPRGSKQRKAKENFSSKHWIAVAEQLHRTIKAAGKNSSRHPMVLDHARQHTSRVSKAAMQRMGLHLKKGFPAQSWDINIIENVWGVLDTKLRQVRGRRPTTPDGWRRRVNKVWAAIPQSTIDKLVGSVKGRMAAIVENGGAWLFAHA